MYFTYSREHPVIGVWTNECTHDDSAENLPIQKGWEVLLNQTVDLEVERRTRQQSFTEVKTFIDMIKIQVTK